MKKLMRFSKDIFTLKAWFVVYEFKESKFFILLLSNILREFIFLLQIVNVLSRVAAPPALT